MKFQKCASRFLAALLTAALLLAPAAPVQAASVGDFKDVSSGDWFYGAVDFGVSRGLFQGSSATMFNPNGRMTRAMFITVLGRYAGVNASAWLAGTVTGSDVNLRSGPGTGYDVVTMMSQGTAAAIVGKSGDWYKIQVNGSTGYVRSDLFSPSYHYFSDVDYGQYYAGYAVWAYEKGIVNGNGSNDRFTPDSTITREQVCTILSRFASVMGAGLGQSQSAGTFQDDGSISSWAKDSVYAMQRSGIVNGDNTGAFRPRGSATRAEAAAMLQRFDNACGGFSAPNQDPVSPPSGQNTTPPSTQNTAPPSSSDGGDDDDDDIATPPKPNTDSVEDTPASLIGGSVSIPASVIRVGLPDMVTTGTFKSSVTSLTLQDAGGAGFDYGTMSGRQFVSSGSSASGSITVVTDGYTFTATDSNGSVYTASGDAFAVHPRSGATTVGGRTYRGEIEMRQASGMQGYITVINFVGIEDFVKGVLPNEFSAWWPMETLKAAAVASRTHIMSMVNGAYNAYGIDVVANDGSQLYRGVSTDGSATSDQAADATAGIYLTYDGRLCVTSYSACNGGTIRSSQEVFGNYYPYLVNKADPYEAAVSGEVSNYAGMVSASHKVGMSQWGAYAMAKVYNKTYDVILGFYFPGTNMQYGA